MTMTEAELRQTLIDRAAEALQDAEHYRHMAVAANHRLERIERLINDEADGISPTTYTALKAILRDRA